MLVERLLAAIKSREDAAKAMAAVYPGPWDLADRGWMARVVADAPNFLTVTSLDQDQVESGVVSWLGDALQHLIFNEPSTVLRRYAADRELIDEHLDVNDGDCGTCVDGRWGYPTHGGASPQSWPCKTLVLLAEAYGITEEEE